MGNFPSIADFILNPSPTVIEQFPNGESNYGAIEMKLREVQVLQKAHPKPKGFFHNSFCKKIRLARKNLSSHSQIVKSNIFGWSLESFKTT